MLQSAATFYPPRSLHSSERSRWDFLTTLLAPAAAQRATPPRRKRARQGAGGEESAAACGWFDSSQDLLQGLSVVESLGGRRVGPRAEPPAAIEGMREEGIIAA
jgi:hypothetical protein